MLARGRRDAARPHTTGEPLPTDWQRRRLAATGAVLAAALTSNAVADEAPAPGAVPERFAAHAQLTYVEQESNDFTSPYRGPNSLTPGSGHETVDATVYLGARLWFGAEGWLNGEIDQGKGLDGTLGVASFPSGEAYKIGRNRPYLRLPRAFIRQTWNLGGEEQLVEPDQNLLRGLRSADRLVLTVGKFGVGDVFDTNAYAHDPRTDFLNWAALDASTFDYAADAWGYTAGIAAEYYRGRWTLRLAGFDLTNVPNSPHLDPGAKQYQLMAELERRHELFGAPGRILLTTFDTRGRMGRLDDAIALAAATGGPVDVVPVRRYRSRTGAHMGLEQSVTEDLGVFARVGGASGNVEPFEFTDVDRSASAGASLTGARWNRRSDTTALAFLVNDLSAARQRYLAADGLGLLVGDGRLPHPGPEQIVEAYYSVGLDSHLHVTFDFQRITNPAFNRDRGPASVVAARVHAQF